MPFFQVLLILLTIAMDPDVSMAEPTQLDPTSPLFHAVFDSKSQSQEIMMQDPNSIKYKPGRGNTIAGERQPYVLYPPSNASNDLSVKDDIWHRFIPFNTDDFIGIFDLAKPLWEQ